MKYTCPTDGKVCAQSIEITLENNIVKEVIFNGGCPGNHQGIANLVKDMPATEVIKRLQGVTCGNRTTSCPDQLARALEKILNTKGTEQ